MRSQLTSAPDYVTPINPTLHAPAAGVQDVSVILQDLYLGNTSKLYKYNIFISDSFPSLQVHKL